MIFDFVATSMCFTMWVERSPRHFVATFAASAHETTDMLKFILSAKFRTLLTITAPSFLENSVRKSLASTAAMMVRPAGCWQGAPALYVCQILNENNNKQNKTQRTKNEITLQTLASVVGRQVMKKLSTYQVTQTGEIFTSVSIHQRSVHEHHWGPYTDAPSAQCHRTKAFLAPQSGVAFTFGLTYPLVCCFISRCTSWFVHTLVVEPSLLAAVYPLVGGGMDG